jgi:sugar/nucleoside kinase (ribokinase family)
VTSPLDLLVLGDANPDLILRGGDVDPAFGQAERLVEEARLTVGGSAAITACAAARLGMRVGFCGVVGDDLFGRFMRDELVARGVDVAGLQVNPSKPTGVTVVLSRPEDRAILTQPGTIAILDMDGIDRDLLARARHVHVGSYFLQTALAPDLPRLFDAAHADGATTSLDPNWDPEERWALGDVLTRTDVVLPNGEEAMRIAHVDDVEEAARRLAATGPLVVVKDGDRGGLAARQDGLVHEAAPSARVVDTTGAGDAFDAGFLTAWLEGRPLREALQLAVACGTLSTRAVGGVDGQPSLEEALALAGTGART